MLTLATTATHCDSWWIVCTQISHESVRLLSEAPVSSGFLQQVELARRPGSIGGQAFSLQRGFPEHAEGLQPWYEARSEDMELCLQAGNIRIEQIKRSISCSLAVHAKNLHYVQENIQRSVFLQGLCTSKNIQQGSICCVCVYFNHLKQHIVVFLPQSDNFRIIL